MEKASCTPTLDNLVLALTVTNDDLLRVHPEQLPLQPKVRFVPEISDAEPTSPLSLGRPAAVWQVGWSGCKQGAILGWFLG